MRSLVLLAAVAGCRFGFGASDGPDESASDSGTDSDAAQAGDANGDGMPDGGPACAGFDLCDGFEAATLDTATWTPDSMVTLSTARAHRGTRSIQVHFPPNPANTSGYQTLNQMKTVMMSQTFWIRGWFWLSALPAAGNGLELITAERPSTAGDYAFVFSDRTTIYSQYSQDARSTSTTVPIGQWFCLVWKVVRSTGSSGSIELSGNVPMLVLSNTQTDSASSPMNVITMGIGFASSNTPLAQPALDLWIDDVIAHGAPVTCTD